MSSDSVSLQSSLLMWALAAIIVWLAAHVMLGWMRQAQEEWEWDLGRLRQVAVGGATFGTAISVAIPLGLAGEALSFPIGYQPLAALGLWLGAIVVFIGLALVPVWREEGASAAGAGVLLGLSITGLQWAWMMSAGFRPGIQWQPAFVGAAGVVSAAGVGTAMALAFPYGERARSYRYSWRIAAAGLVGLSFLSGYALLLYAADLPTQMGSAFRYELPGGLISLVGGAVVPIVLMLMAMDLETRRRQRRRLWRSRRRGENVSSYGGDSVMAPMDMEPSRFLMQGPGRDLMASGSGQRAGAAGARPAAAPVAPTAPTAPTPPAASSGPAPPAEDAAH
jgi:NO-binding membrane sensor protein with MHYT domain